MKRSHVVGLVLASGAVASIALLSDRPQAKAYSSVDACTQAGEQTRGECEEAFSKAQAEHERQAPRYDAMAVCEQEYGAGNCTERREAGGGGFFMPLMLGYMMGRSFAPAPLYAGAAPGTLRSPTGYGFAAQGGGYGPAQNCRQSSSGGCGGGGSGGARWFGGTGGTGSARTATSAGTAAGTSSGTVQRGGFGSTGAAMQGGGAGE